jgi:hypothetical protein
MPCMECEIREGTEGHDRSGIRMIPERRADGHEISS